MPQPLRDRKEEFDSSQSKTLDEKKELSTDPDPDSDPKQSAEAALPAELISAGSQQLHRKLGGKEIQLFAVGGAIGTCT